MNTTNKEKIDLTNLTGFLDLSCVSASVFIGIEILSSIEVAIELCVSLSTFVCAAIIVNACAKDLLI